MNTSITTFIFDCFGVICDPVLGGWYKKNVLDQGRLDENLHEIFRQFDLGKMSEDDVLDYFSKYDGVTLTKEELRNDIDSFLKLDTTLASLVKKLRQMGFKTALLSNGNHSFFERKIYAEYPEFKTLFDKIVISSTIGMVKPDPEIYKHVLEQISSKPEESLFIDDSKVNVEGAIKVGLQGYIYTTSEDFKKYLATIGINLEV